MQQLTFLLLLQQQEADASALDAEPQQEAVSSVVVLPVSLSAGFLAVMVEDMMNSPTLRPLPHFSSYSLDTGFSLTETSTKPAILMMFSSSSTEEAPLTQQECMLGSFCSSSGICFIMTISQIEIRPPGFRTRKISR